MEPIKNNSVISDLTKIIVDASQNNSTANDKNCIKNDNNNNVVVDESSDKKKSSKNELDEVKIPALDKYNLRTKSIQNRIEAEKKRKNPRKEPKPKQKPPPLSKYRRKNANARERTRMQEINDAFEVLKHKVPPFPAFEKTKDPTSKLTKITTLRLAVNYIRALRSILDRTEAIPRPRSPPPQPASLPPPTPSSRAKILPTIAEKVVEMPITTSTISTTRVTSPSSIINIAAHQLINQQQQISQPISITKIVPKTATFYSSNVQQPQHHHQQQQQQQQHQQQQNQYLNQSQLPLLTSSTLSTIIPSDDSKQTIHKPYNNFELDPMDELNSLDCDPISVDIDSLFLYQQYRSSNIGSDGLSCSSPSTSTETESLGSLKSGCSSGWDFSVDEGLDVADTFDIILESDESMNNEPIL